MGRPDRANRDTENDACRRASQSQAPAMRRPARTAKPQGRISEHEASFQTRGPHRSRRRREQERRISRSNQEIPACRNGRALMHPSRPLGAGLGCGSPSGQRGRPFGPAWPAIEPWRVQRAISPSVRQGGARALAPLRQKQRTRRSSASQTHVSIVSGRTTGTTLLAYRQITLSGRLAA